nr:transposase (putative), gypsy type [Tanacetum cinerariifolium]
MVGVYTKFFEFANFRLSLSQFLFDILGYYQIYLSQLSVIGAAKTSPEAGPEDQETVALEVPLPEDVPTTRGVPEVGPAKRVAATDPPAVKECRKRGHDGADANAPPKVLRRDHADPRPTGSTHEGKSFASIELGTGSSKGAAAAGDPKSENTSFASMVESPESIYRPEWGIPNGSTLDTPEACQDLVNHIAPPEMDARLDALSIDFDKELYPHMLTAIAGCRSMIGRGLCLAMMKCNESIKLRQAFADVMSAGIAKGMSEGLKHGWVHELRPNSSQLMILVYPEVRGPMDPWACKEEMLVADAIAANVSRAEKK